MPTTTAKGLGWQHMKRRAKLLSQHIDGVSCWWCGRPMYKDRTRNWDYDPASSDLASGSLSGDHSIARANGGTVTDRLVHNLCNKRRGDGRRDHLRPALSAMTGGCDRNSLDWA